MDFFGLVRPADQRLGARRRLIGLSVAALLLATPLVSVPMTVAGASPRQQHVTALPRAVDVRAVAMAEDAPGYRQPLRRDLPALSPRGSSRPPTSSVTATPVPLRNSEPRVAAPWPGFDEEVSFAGMADAATLGSSHPVVEPPDPWIAAGPNHVVQAVNTRLRFSSRQGVKLYEVSLASFFDEPTSEVLDSDPRILYDAIHGRWLASELSADCATGHVRLAVSDTGDPTLGWHIWDIAFPGGLPDYPGLGSSSDKVAFSANVFGWSSCSDGGFQFGEVGVIDWADILAGGSVTTTFWTEGSILTFRPAANLTADPVIHAIAEDGRSGDVLYGWITGSNKNGDAALTILDLTSGGLPAFATPPQPQDPLGTIGPQTVDSRPTDAVWQAGHLWFVSTYPHSYDGGSTYRDVVRVTEIATTGAPTPEQDFLLGDAGYDAFYGGIGLSRVGGLYVVYTESSSAAYASLIAAYQSPSAGANAITGYRVLASGLAGYTGSRWGDYVGVATDPVDPYAVWQAGEYTNTAGSWSTRVSKLTAEAPVAVKQGVHTGYKFSSSGAVTGEKTYTLAHDSGASASRRQTITNQSGTWLAISSGVWAGYWVRESSEVYLSASPIILPPTPNATFNPAVKLLFSIGTHTGYKFSASGAVTGEKTYTLANDSGSYTSARSSALINQTGTWFLVSSGVWAGYWVRASSVVYLANPSILPPTIISRSPSPGAVNIGLSPTVTAQFSEDVTGVSTTSMAISNLNDLVNLPATVTYDPVTHTATLVPSAQLVMGTYRIALSGRIKDLDANSLAWTTWTFTTAAPVAVKQGVHTGYKFSSSGAVTGEKTYTLAHDSGASASRRQTITNQSGTWLAISSGVWAGYWVRESSEVYLSASPIILPPTPNATFNPAVKLLFSIGTHTGYKFSASGAVTGEKTYTLANDSGSYTSARSSALINQTGTWFLVSSGVWAGYWVRASSVVYL